MWSPLILSLKVAAISTLLVAMVGLGTALLLSFREFRGRKIIEATILLPMVLPPTVTGFYLILLLGRNGLIGSPLYEWFKINIMFTWPAAVIASFVVSLPIMVRSCLAAIESVDREMVDSATMLGYNRLQTSCRVIVPLAWPGIFAGVVLAFTRGIGEFGATLMLAGNIPERTSTMPLAIYGAATSGDWETAHLLVAVLSFITVGLLVLSSRVGKKLYV